jgi:hypothetical protein
MKWIQIKESERRIPPEQKLKLEQEKLSVWQMFEAATNMMPVSDDETIDVDSSCDDDMLDDNSIY